MYEARQNKEKVSRQINIGGYSALMQNRAKTKQKNTTIQRIPEISAVYVERLYQQKGVGQHKVPISKTISPVVQTNVQRLKLQHSLTIQNRGIIQRKAILEYKNLNDDGLIYEKGRIVYTKHEAGELKSPEFSGCIMAAFKFIRDPEESDDLYIVDDNNIIKINKNNLQTYSDIFDTKAKYIAHVYAAKNEEGGDQKYEFVNLEKNGLIEIEAMFKPYIAQRDFKDIQDASQKGTLRPTITGAMNFVGSEWEAETYYSNGTTSKERFNHEKLKKETYKTYGILGLYYKAVPQGYEHSYMEGLNICGQDGRIIRKEYWKKLSKACRDSYVKGRLNIWGQYGKIIKILDFQNLLSKSRQNSYIEGLNICGQYGRIIRRQDFQNLSKECKKSYIEGLKICGQYGRIIRRQDFQNLSKECQNSYTEGYKMKLDEMSKTSKIIDMRGENLKTKRNNYFRR